VLVHPHGRIMATASDRLPTFRVQPRAEFLHGVGAPGAADWFRGQLEAVVGLLELSVSRVDLHGDFQGWELSGDDRTRFVCRARSRATYEDDGTLTGFVFGKRKSGTLGCRIYDKTAEILRSGAAYWPDLWSAAAGYDPGEPVWRVESEFSRQILGQFGLRSPESVIESAGALWSYATTEWLTLRIPSADTTRSRWAVDPTWEQVRRAALGVRIPMIPYTCSDVSVHVGRAGSRRPRSGRRLGLAIP